MKSLALAIVLILSIAPDCGAKSKPTEDCTFADAGFSTPPGQKVQIAEVANRAAVKLEVCGSPNGCVEAPVSLGTPVEIYRRQGGWTCGYVSGNNGAGPAWILTDALRVVPYDDHPPLKAWLGTWTGGEDRVRIRADSVPGTVLLEGSAEWSGKYTSHFGDTKGSASPEGNHLHFVENGPDSCTIEMTLLGRYILASDNQACGGLNARFQGIWKRTSP
jgi:hypothetical protein